MKVHILDKAALEAISPKALTAFATSLGWQHLEPYGSYSHVYTLAETQQEILIPTTQQLGDYARVVSQLIGAFAEQTQRNELMVYRDLLGADKDVIRISTHGADSEGVVSINAGVALVTQAKQLLLAAACATYRPQSVYRSGANKEATEYMERVKLGQTEHGSFVITLLAPVPPIIQPALPLYGDAPPLPQERKVTLCLLKALQATRHAIERVNAGDADGFAEASQQGISANLCDALATLSNLGSALGVDFHWAKTLPSPKRDTKVIFKKDDSDILREVATQMRDQEPREDTVIFGKIFRLQRDDDMKEGTITLKGLLEDKQVSVTADLDTMSYKTAIHAHENQLSVIARGDLERRGQRWVLTRASLTELPEEESTLEDE